MSSCQHLSALVSMRPVVVRWNATIHLKHERGEVFSQSSITLHSNWYLLQNTLKKMELLDSVELTPQLLLGQINWIYIPWHYAMSIYIVVLSRKSPIKLTQSAHENKLHWTCITFFMFSMPTYVWLVMRLCVSDSSQSWYFNVNLV